MFILIQYLCGSPPMRLRRRQSCLNVTAVNVPSNEMNCSGGTRTVGRLGGTYNNREFVARTYRIKSDIFVPMLSGDHKACTGSFGFLVQRTRGQARVPQTLQQVVVPPRPPIPARLPAWLRLLA